MSELRIRTRAVRHPVAPDLYGLFFEDINRAGDGGLYAELLRNRSFEDSLIPERATTSVDGATFTSATGWVSDFNGGEGRASWLTGLVATHVPAWIDDAAAMTVDEGDTLNAARKASLRVEFQAGGSIANSGFHGIPLAAGSTYDCFFFAKGEEQADAELIVALVASDGTICDERSVTISPGAYRRYDLALTAALDTAGGRLLIRSASRAIVRFGFTSLMPAETHHGHGLRPDLVRMLEGLSPAFLRFPGGCIVEGFSRETALRFSNTIGPVWERPSHQLTWGYRTTNGLGFHEYLQLCEDLDAEPIYVVNCGMTCQTRGCELLEGEDLDRMLQEALDAMAYARGDASSPFGAMRAAAGREEPFRLTYVEIGNENFGPAYEERYRLFFDAIHTRYPDVRLISNAHTEKAGLPTQIVGEHFYDTADFFAESTGLYDHAPRTGPAIFVGEYAVNAGMDVANLRAALAETMFLLGLENNQDIVRLSSYAPLFENVHYAAWSPNLIAFDTTRVFGIPTYHALAMLARNRGDAVVEVDWACGDVSRQSMGLPGLISTGGGLQFTNARLDGVPIDVSHLVQGRFTERDGVFTAVEDEDTGIRLPFPGAENLHRIVGGTFSQTPVQSSTFEIDIRSRSDTPFTIGVWCNAQRGGGADDGWTIRTIDMHGWSIADGVSRVSAGRFPPILLAPDATVELKPERFHRYKVITRANGFDCYIDDRLIQQAVLPRHAGGMATATITDDRVIVKIVNISDHDDPVDIDIDAAVDDVYRVDLLTGARDARNSLEFADAVTSRTSTQSGASASFTYVAPPFSFSILTLGRAEESAH